MATTANANPRRRGRRASANLILKEGFLYKKGGVIKSWSRRYFILMHQSLCYFKREFETHAQNQEGLDKLEPLGRIFLSDIVSISTEGVEKKKAFVFALHTKKRAVLLQASNTDDKEKWVEAIRRALETDKEAERKDPFRQTLRKLAPGEHHPCGIASTSGMKITKPCKDTRCIFGHLFLLTVNSSLA